MNPPNELLCRRLLSPTDAAPRFLSFESRRAEEMRSLIARQGGVPTVAPSMREIPLDENPAAFEFAENLIAGRIDAVLFLTGVGAQALLDAVKLRYEESQILAALDRTFIAVRGPKPTVVLKKWGVHIDVKAPEPNTWRETAVAIRNAIDLKGKTIAVQEYGKPNEALVRRTAIAGSDGRAGARVSLGSARRYGTVGSGSPRCRVERVRHLRLHERSTGRERADDRRTDWHHK